MKLSTLFLHHTLNKPQATKIAKKFRLQIDFTFIYTRKKISKKFCLNYTSLFREEFWYPTKKKKFKLIKNTKRNKKEFYVTNRLDRIDSKYHFGVSNRPVIEQQKKFYCWKTLLNCAVWLNRRKFHHTAQKKTFSCVSTRIYSEKNAEMLIMIYFFEEKNLNMTVGWDGFVRFELGARIMR